ncbi:tryptophan--tRNA ligase [Candidatus Pacearchaeota archaeon]|nr:tryptophan--tRNA ligase [Candidatus Pacearchaeota archaeon]
MKEEFKVTPWEVSGEIDYEKLIREFGIMPMPKLPKFFNENIFFRRGIIFAHRDFNRIIEAIERKKKFVMMTGLMPSGKFHIGHMILAKQIIFYQSLGARVYITIADLETYHARGQSLEESKKTAVEEYILNYAALGLKPQNCDIYFQSERSKEGKRDNAYYRLQNLLAKHTTFNEFKAVYGEISPGKMISVLLQASDMLHPQLPEFENKVPVVVPVGVDQDPHIRLARDISQRIKNPRFIQLSSTYHKFIPGLKGGKMSSSDPMSFIALTDSAKEVEMKIKKYAFSGGRATIEEHRKRGGNPEIDVCFQYLKFFFEPDDDKLEKIYNDYKTGKMLTWELKEITIGKINNFLKEHQRKREEARKKIKSFLD